MSIKKWHTIKSKVVFDHPRMRLVEDEVLLPNGQSMPYLHAPTTRESVAVIAFNETDEVLLQQEYSYPCDAILWQLPGGAVEPGEGIFEAANRELSEESGYVAGSIKLLGWYFTNNRRSNAKQYVVLCWDITRKQAKADPEEFIESHWVSLNTLTKRIVAGEIHNINLLAGIALLQQHIHGRHPVHDVRRLKGGDARF